MVIITTSKQTHAWTWICGEKHFKCDVFILMMINLRGGGDHGPIKIDNKTETRVFMSASYQWYAGKTCPAKYFVYQALFWTDRQVQRVHLTRLENTETKSWSAIEWVWPAFTLYLFTLKQGS